MKTHGGKRPGSGRPKQSKTATAPKGAEVEITPERARRIERALQAGQPISKIAKAEGIDRRTLQRSLRVVPTNLNSATNLNNAAGNQDVTNNQDEPAIEQAAAIRSFAPESLIPDDLKAHWRRYLDKTWGGPESEYALSLTTEDVLEWVAEKQAPEEIPINPDHIHANEEW